MTSPRPKSPRSATWCWPRPDEPPKTSAVSCRGQPAELAKECDAPGRILEIVTEPTPRHLLFRLTGPRNAGEVEAYPQSGPVGCARGSQKGRGNTMTNTRERRRRAAAGHRCPDCRQLWALRAAL